MKQVFLASLFFIGQVFPADALVDTQPVNVEFTILITSYKNEKWAKDNFKSACCQKSTNPYKVIYINDCSSDRTGEIIDAYVQKHKLGSFVTVIHNKKRVGAMENIYTAIHTIIPDNHVVVSLDGDDMLAHDEVLLQLEKAYSDPAIWMTYGSVLQIPSGKPWMSMKVPNAVFKEKKLRQHHPFVKQHLRTFKAALFKKVKKEDLMYEGEFMQVTWDMACMFPMLEMASAKDPETKNHHLFIDEILYFYRVNNPINDFRVHQEAQAKMDDYIRSKPPYEPLESLDNEDSMKLILGKIA